MTYANAATLGRRYAKTLINSSLAAINSSSFFYIGFVRQAEIKDILQVVYYSATLYELYMNYCIIGYNMTYLV